MGEIAKKWYVVRAAGGKEKKAKEYIENEIKRLGLEDYVSKVLIPTEKIYVVRNGKRIAKERNLYSGYVFVEAILTGEVIHILRNTTNVIDFLGGKSNKPEPLRQSEVNKMLGAADEMQESDENFVDYNVGEVVKVCYGPFSGFTGVIEEVNNEN